jgi:hypothetical protein
MRRIVVPVTLLVLALPIAAGAAVRTPGDGTLFVRDLDGQVTVSAKGGVIGRCDRCTLFLNERIGADEIVPVVSGAKGADTDQVDDTSERWSNVLTGKPELRWRVIGGSFKMIVRNGSDVDVSVVGRGWVKISGSKGTYVVNGGQSTPVAPGPNQVVVPLQSAIVP